MPLALSLYLDVIRFSAAMIVFFGHLSGSRFTGGLFWQIGAFTGEAVTVFFVLSGYVIAYVISTREQNAKIYVIDRATRIFSVAVPAVLLTLVLDTIGRVLRDDLYNIGWGYQPDGLLWQFLSGLLFVGQLWNMEMGVGSNLSYWSLQYEVWYYVIFGALVFAPVRWRVPVVVGLLILVGPQIALLFPVWLLGVIAYRISVSGRISPPIGLMLAVGSLILLVLLELMKRHYGQLPSWSVQPRMANDYVVGLLFATHLAGLYTIAHRSPPVPNVLASAIRWCAGATFTIYLFHLPVSQFVITIMPWPPSAWQARLVIFGGGLIIMFAIAAVTERRKDIWRRSVTTAIYFIWPKVTVLLQRLSKAVNSRYSIQIRRRP